MRVIFLLILIANLAVAGWWGYSHYYAAATTTAAPATPPPPSRVVQLRLLHELAAEERQPLSAPTQAAPPEVAAVAEISGSSAAEVVSADKKASCYRIDGIVRKEQRDALAVKIAAQNHTVLESGESFLERKVYWVHIPPMKSYDAASNVAAALAKAKVRDFFLVKAGDAKNGISLGLFTQKDGAEKRQQQIALLKLNAPRPAIRERASTVRSYWLSARAVGDGEKSLAAIFVSENQAAVAIDCPP